MSIETVLAFRPCPFCGHAAHATGPVGPANYEQRFAVCCASDECRVAAFAFGRTVEEAAAKWNRRAKGVAQ